ncbi:MAG: T9SS type A sorting domain-containing protein [Candidatus Cloacimonetes bacterium]|nr:T9SS type A sorting domain-containing protein [Candidatus Cloacimonadota bacterium]
MSRKKIIFGVVLILFCTSLLSAQVNFQHVCTLHKPSSGISYQVTQLFDYDNNDIDEIITQYYDVDQYLQYIIISDISGTIIDSIVIDDWFFYDEYVVSDEVILFNKSGVNVIMRAQVPYFQGRLRFSLQDCETLSYIDSLNIFPLNNSMFSEVFIIDFYQNDNEDIFLVGANEFSFFAKEDPNHTCLFKFKIDNDSLNYIDGYYNTGMTCVHPDNIVLLSVGKYSYASVGSGVSCFSYYYLQKITKVEPILQTQLHSTGGNVVWEKDSKETYYHYPKNYDVITKNNQDDSPQVLQYRRLDSDDGTSVHFKAYETINWQEIWSKEDSQIGLGKITASSCVQVNNEDHYVMYFRGDKLEIRDRLNGNIIHHQDSVLAVCDILRKSDGDLLFFVEKDDETGYDVYSLDGPIFVSNDEPPTQNEFVIEQYPNPFKNDITFSFSSKEPTQNVGIKIYNIKGQLERALRFNTSSLSRFHTVIWDGRDNSGNAVSQGVYLYRINLNKQEISGKIIKLDEE